MTHIRPDVSKVMDLLAAVWHGPVPGTIRLREYLYLDGMKSGMMLVWEGDGEALSWVESTLQPFAEVVTHSAEDGSGGMAACFARDPDAFGDYMRGDGAAGAEVAKEINRRRAAMEAPNLGAAIEAVRALG